MLIELTHPSPRSSTVRIFVASTAVPSSTFDEVRVAGRIARRTAWFAAIGAARLIVHMMPNDITLYFPTVEMEAEPGGVWAVVRWHHDGSPAALAAVAEAVKASETGVL